MSTTISANDIRVTLPISGLSLLLPNQRKYP